MQVYTVEEYAKKLLIFIFYYWNYLFNVRLDFVVCSQLQLNIYFYF